jgi:uncharacterized protein (TIGR03435 family)
MTGFGSVGICAILAGSCLAIAQDGALAPAFEVASVKLSPPLAPGENPGMHVSSSAARLDYLRVQLVVVIREAYGVTWQLEPNTGPESISSERYDIQATIPQPATKEQVQLMWQRLLAERFHLKVHWEERPRPEYALVVGKGVLKIAPVSTDPDKQHTARVSPIPGGRRVTFDSITMERLIGYVGVGGPVRNMTDTPGAFSFTLDYSPDPSHSVPTAADGNAGAAPVSEPLLPSFADALRMKTGLELERRVVPTKLLIVDHADRIPTAN